MNPHGPSSTPTTKKRLGILQAGRAPEEIIDEYPDYNQLFVDLLGESTFDYQSWAVLDNEFPGSINDADAWLITGSRFGAYEDHAWIPPLEQLIRDIQAKGDPLIGICFGHQIIAQALGGKVVKFDGGWSVGRAEYDLDPVIFANQTQPVSALMAFHQDQVVELPDGAKTVGSSDFCQYAALAYGSTILTIQPHPEFNQSFVGALVEARKDLLPEDIVDTAIQTLTQPIANDGIAQTFRTFLNKTTENS